jgi:2-polyprenyl-3-methyl-5-hydroxy-6-metoxy-1,4-benzoquinol methylase
MRLTPPRLRSWDLDTLGVVTEQTASEEAQAGAPGAPEEIPERFIPAEMSGSLVEAEHIARYHWAASFCSGRRVLDAGCGSGYGSELINAAGAAEVVGIDRSEAALALARAAVTEGVVLAQGDVEDLEFPDDSFDAVVCFEVIEHVDDVERTLDEFTRVLRPDGLLIVSSPNRDRYVPGNPHHVRELLRDELQTLLDARFPSARIISQHVMLASAVTWAGAPLFDGVTTLRPAAPAAEDEVYLLAIAGRDLPPDPGPIIALEPFAEPRRWLEFIAGQARHIAELERHQSLLQERVHEAELTLVRLADLEARMAKATAELAELEEARLTALHERHAETERLRGEIAELQRREVAIKSTKAFRLVTRLQRLAALPRR